MDVTRYNRADCSKLLEDEDFWSQPRLPTSRRRMASYVANPRVTDDDILLYTAHKDGTLVSYLAVLPDELRTAAGDLQRFGWLTSWWADRDSNLGPAASLLLFKTLSDWRGAIGVSGFSKVSAKVYNASRRFRSLRTFDLCMHGIKLPREFKGRRIPGGPINALLDLRNRRYPRRMAERGVSWSVVERIEPELDAFIVGHTAGDLFPRDAAFMDWLLQYQWLRPAEPADEAPDSEKSRYFFQTSLPVFRQLGICVRQGDEILGFLMLTDKEEQLLVKYAVFAPEAAREVCLALQAIAVETGRPFLSCADERLNAALADDRFFYLAAKHIPVPFIIGKNVEYDNRARLHYGLGDRVMT